MDGLPETRDEIPSVALFLQPFNPAWYAGSIPRQYLPLFMDQLNSVFTVFLLVHVDGPRRKASCKEFVSPPLAVDSLGSDDNADCSSGKNEPDDGHC